jgi:phage gpG-like protein
MTDIVVRVDMSDVIHELEDMGHELETYPMELIAEGLVGAVDDLIQSEGNGEWQPLSPNTLKRRPRRIGGKLLQDRGFLANIQPSHGDNWAEARSPAPYAGFHITGTKHMDARDWTAVDLNDVMETFLDQVMEEAVAP